MSVYRIRGESTGNTYLKVQEKAADVGVADETVGSTVEGVDLDAGSVTPLARGVMFDVAVASTVELDAGPEAETGFVDDCDRVVPGGVLVQAASAPFEGLVCSLLSSVPVDHDKLQSMVNLASAKSDQALISFNVFI